MVSVSSVDLDAYVDDVNAPIPPPDDAPSDAAVTGTRVAYDDDFLAVKARIDSLGTLSGRIDQEKALSDEESLYEEEEATDFAFIASTGHRILAEKSKDLRIACYVALALYHTRGLEGLVAGIDGLVAIVDTYWDDLFPPPKRMRGRGASLNFLMQRLTDALERAPTPTADDRPHLEHLIDRLDTLTSTLMDAMGEHAPVTSKLKRRLESLLKDAPEPDPKPDPKPDPEPEPNAEREDESSGEGTPDRAASERASETTAADPAGEASASEASTESSAPDAPAADDASPTLSPTGDGTPSSSEASPTLDLSNTASAQETVQTVVRAAGLLRDADPTDPRPYQLLRTMRWAELQTVPHNDGGRTRIQPPNARRLDFLRGLLDDGAPDTLVTQAEDSFQQPPFHFWLDLQRLLVLGMERSDADYARARRVVLVETALLVERVPGVLDLTFADGTPFADDATRAWIDTTVRDAVGGNEAGDGAHDAVHVATKEAKRVLGADGIDAALAVLGSVSAGDASQRTRFRVRLATAQTCLDAGRPRVARPLLDALVDDGTRLALADWEPHLMADVWATLYRCCRRLSVSDASASAGGSEDALDESASGESASGASGADLAQRGRDAYERVCALDPTRALALPTPDL